MNLSIPTPLALSVTLQGLALSLGLIMAIGAQNAFVLRQGLRREHVGMIVLFCAVMDALLPHTARRRCVVGDVISLHAVPLKRLITWPTPKTDVAELPHIASTPNPSPGSVVHVVPLYR